MNNVDEKMKKILPYVDEDFFGKPAEEYINIFLKEVADNEKNKAPKEYIDFLKKYGVGDLTTFFRIDSELLEHEKIYGRTIKKLEGIFVFGSDIGEYVYAFDTKNNWEVVDIDSSGEIFKRYGDFNAFICQILDEIIESQK